MLLERQSLLTIAQFDERTFVEQLEQVNPQSGPLLTALSTAHNNLLDKKLKELLKTTDIEITQLDLNGLFDEIITHPDRFGFTNAEAACLAIALVA